MRRSSAYASPVVGLILVVLAVGCANSVPEAEQADQASSDPWQYPIRLGDTRAAVHDLVGSPGRVTAELEEYPASGVTVLFDSQGFVTKINFAGPASRIYSTDPVGLIPTDHPVFRGLSGHADERAFVDALGDPLSGGEERAVAVRERRRVWRRDGYLIEALFLGVQRRDGDQSYSEGTLVWFDVFRGI